MERLFLGCAIRAFLLIGVTAILLNMMKVRDAAAMHRVWTGVMALMLLLPLWAQSGPKVSLPILAPQPPSVSAPTAPTSSVQSPAMKSNKFSMWELSFVTAYLLGFCSLFLRLVVGTIHARRLARGSVLLDGVRTNPLCVSPVTVGLFRPVVIFPENWRQWDRSKLRAIMTHEEEHARRHDSLIQWLALLNRAMFWFHPAAWWLQRTLSGLAEQACDDAVLRRGHDAREYAECLLEIAKSVSRSGKRFSIVGMAAPGDQLRKRLRNILEVGPLPSVTPIRMVGVTLVCVMVGTLVLAATPGHAANTKVSPIDRSMESANQASTKFVLGDLRIAGEVRDREQVQEAIFRQWQNREFNTADELLEKVVEIGVRNYFQERGYLKAVAHDPATQLLAAHDGKQPVVVSVAITQGDQYRLGTIMFRSTVAGHALSFPTTTLREQFELRQNDVFNVAEVRTGLEKIKGLYKTPGRLEAVNIRFETDDAAHRVDVIVEVTEKTQKS